ncbi:MAG: type II toxin-antitoxin system HicA family toxin [archaeon]
MSKLPTVKPEKLIKIVKKLGFEEIHVKGSHHVFKHSDGRRLVVPVHKGKNIGKGLLLKIIKEQLKLTREEFQELL